MNPYATQSQTRFQPHDVANTKLTYPSFIAAAVLAASERQRGWQADAEVDWLLQQNGVPRPTGKSGIAMVRQAIGASLVRVGTRLAGTSATGAAPATSPVTGMLQMAD